MLDPRPFDANVETVPHFAFELGAEFAAEERCDVVGLDGVNSGARQVLVDSLQVRLFAENDIGGVLALVGAPVISRREIAINRTVPRANSSSFRWIRLAAHPLAIRWARGQSAISTKALSTSRYSIPCLRN